MDFAVLPPEINSGRMYSGPGSGPLLAAAGSWDSLSAELDITAAICESVLSSLTGLHWRGPAATAMSTTAAPYLGWLYTTAERAKRTALQARAAAAAYEQAYAMTVPPVAVAANRTQLASLIATNFFGQNAAAIAATEAQYAEYWAQDAAAMYGYAISAAAAAQLPMFSSPRQITSPAGVTAQIAAAAQALTGAVASNPVLQALSGLLSQNGIVGEDFAVLDGILATFSAVKATDYAQAFVTGVIGAEHDFGVLPNLGAAATQAGPGLTTVPQLGGAASRLGGGVTATLARANTIGAMSVPASWSESSGNPVAALSGSGPHLSDAGEPAGSRAGMPGIPGLPGGTTSRPSGVVPRYGARITVMARPPAAG